MARVVAQVKNEISSWLTSLGAGEVSREFFELIKAIGEARSKQVPHLVLALVLAPPLPSPSPLPSPYC